MEFSPLDHHLIAGNTSEEATKLLALLPDEVLKAALEHRGYTVAPNVGSVALEGVNESEEDVQDLDHEINDREIRRPIYKSEFMQYVNSRLAEGEPRQMQAQAVTVGRLWNGFVYLHKTSSDSGRKIDIASATKAVGTDVPSFEDIHYKQEYADGIYTVHTDGLDMDQATRYMIGIANMIRERQADGQPFDSASARLVISRAFPTYSFVGCQLFCEFVELTAKQDSGLPEDINVDSIEQATKVFTAIVAQQTSNIVFLEDNKNSDPLIKEDVLACYEAPNGITMSQREHDIINLSYGFDGETLTIKEIGRHFGITTTRVRQILRQAEHKVRASKIIDDLYN